MSSQSGKSCAKRNVLIRAIGLSATGILLLLQIACSPPSVAESDSSQIYVSDYVGEWKLSSIDYGDRVLSEEDIALSDELNSTILLLTREDAQRDKELYLGKLITSEINEGIVWTTFDDGYALMTSEEKGGDSYPLNLIDGKLYMEVYEPGTTKLSSTFIFSRSTNSENKGETFEEDEFTSKLIGTWNLVRGTNSDGDLLTDDLIGYLSLSLILKEDFSGTLSIGDNKSNNNWEIVGEDSALFGELFLYCNGEQLCLELGGDFLVLEKAI